MLGSSLQASRLHPLNRGHPVIDFATSYFLIPPRCVGNLAAGALFASVDYVWTFDLADKRIPTSCWWAQRTDSIQKSRCQMLYFFILWFFSTEKISEVNDGNVHFYISLKDKIIYTCKGWFISSTPNKNKRVSSPTSHAWKQKSRGTSSYLENFFRQWLRTSAL